MWLGELLAAEAPPGANDSLIVMVGGVIVAALGALSLVLVEVVKGRNSRNASPSSPPQQTVVTDEKVVERVAVLWNWRQEIRAADDIHDRTLFETADDVKDVVIFLNRQHPGWRP